MHEINSPLQQGWPLALSAASSCAGRKNVSALFLTEGRL
jgi:hypothetical protein